MPFRRYTNLAAAIHMLSIKKITLLNPATWDDKNDAYFMSEYKRLKKAQSLLALCFAETSETYHHWRVFSHGSDGVCIEFDKEKLLTTFDKKPGVVHRAVGYERIDKLKNDPAISVDHLPFLKRLPYKDEQEYRVVFVDQKRAVEFQDYEIDPAWILRITLSPWISTALEKSVKSTLKSLCGSTSVNISRSTLVNNEEWKGVTARF